MIHAYIRRFAWAGLLFLIVVPRSFAQASEDAGTNAFISDLNTLIARAALSLGNTHITETETMSGLLRLWDRRQTLGAGNFDLANAFLFVIEENPKAFFESMIVHPSAFDQWLKDLPDQSFVWYKAPPCQLDTKQKQLIFILQRTQIPDANASRLKDKTLARLSTIRCRQID